VTPPVTPDAASESAGSRFLDALRAGDVDGATSLLPADATLRIADVTRTWTGPEQISAFLKRGIRDHPEAAYQAHTRHIGRGAVIDDARLVGVLAGSRPGETAEVPTQLTVRDREGEVGSIHVWIPPIFLSALQGAHVDAQEMSVAQMTVSLRPLNDPSLTTIQLAAPKPVAIPKPAAVAPVVVEEPRRGRRGLLVLALILLLLIGGGAFAYMNASKDSGPPQATPSPTPPSSKPTLPKPTKTTKPNKPSHTVKPTVTLSANLAFGIDSAQLSSAARRAIIQLADKARRNKVTGTIEVDGYTDSVGSAAHGLALSRKRASAVAALLRSELSGLDITVISKGNGEANPVASNATAAGRAKNRRVEIFLPDQ
jgi:predicted ribosomally synthesized peptide with SipW-like signal peptide